MSAQQPIIYAEALALSAACACLLLVAVYFFNVQPMLKPAHGKILKSEKNAALEKYSIYESSIGSCEPPFISPIQFIPARGGVNVARKNNPPFCL